MHPRKEIDNFDLEAPDLEIFSSTIPLKTTPPKAARGKLTNTTFGKFVLTLSLLLFLFGSTFFIASKMTEPSFKISSADIGYLPQAVIDMPQIKAIKSCSEITYLTESADFLNSFCRGDFCINNKSKSSCEAVDILSLKNNFLPQEGGEDGITDCVWIEKGSLCKPKY